ncbi:MAG: HEPN domain-containing protein [Phycisphaerales bacterium]
MKIDDTSLDIFESASKRASRLLRYSSGLQNRRTRAMRADWKSSFEKFMGPKFGRISDRVDGHDAMVVLKTGASLKYDDFKAEHISDLQRASLVMQVSAMDAYFHSKILSYVVRCSKREKGFPAALAKKAFRLDFVADLLSSTTRRPWSKIQHSLKKSMGYQSLQQPGKIADGLSLIGVENFWSQVSAKMNQNEKTVKNQLVSVVDRRNKIVHEGDLYSSKKSRGKDRPLSPRYVEDSNAFIIQLINASDFVINKQLRKMK